MCIFPLMNVPVYIATVMGKMVLKLALVGNRCIVMFGVVSGASFALLGVGTVCCHSSSRRLQL